MDKSHEYFQKELGLNKKTSEAIKILVEEELLGTLLVELRDVLEVEVLQDSNKPIGENFA
jgi:hypothetical protein